MGIPVIKGTLLKTVGLGTGHSPATRSFTVRLPTWAAVRAFWERRPK